MPEDVALAKGPDVMLARLPLGNGDEVATMSVVGGVVWLEGSRLDVSMMIEDTSKLDVSIELELELSISKVLKGSTLDVLVGLTRRRVVVVSSSKVLVTLARRVLWGV